MRTVGQILRESRVGKHLTLPQVEQTTKIRVKFLEAIEADDYTKLPSLAYAKGFVKNYSEFLGLNPSDMMAFYRRQTQEISRSSLLPKGMSEPLNASPFRLTPTRFLMLIASILVGLFLLYLGLQYTKLQSAPSLIIESPQNKIVSDQPRIDFFGKTDTDATVTINGVSVIVRSDGRFFDQVKLDPGVNKVVITATSRYGKISTATYDIGYQQP
jgi:cytoskeletal protein RodZ